MKNKRSELIIRIVFILLSILWMIVIYSFSAEPAVESDKTSGSVMAFIADLFDIADPELFALRYEVVLRKCAHATEYMILALLLYAATYRKKGSCISNMMLPFVIAVLYACSDEYHQLFVPGRDGDLKDVFIDSAGAAFAVAVITFLRIKNLKEIKVKNTGNDYGE